MYVLQNFAKQETSFLTLVTTVQQLHWKYWGDFIGKYTWQETVTLLKTTK